MTAKRDEWPQVANIHWKAYGIHPWFVTRHNIDEDLMEMEHLLLDNPKALVGEIGIDLSATDVTTNALFDVKIQEEFFDRQMKLAAHLRRPVSIHSVHAQSILLPYFQKLDRSKCTLFPPSIMMHSFAGSNEFLIQLLKLKRLGPRFFFSVSMFVNARSKRMEGLIKLIPADRILIETDLCDEAVMDEAMAKVALAVGNARGWSEVEVVTKTIANTQDYLSFI